MIGKKNNNLGKLLYKEPMEIYLKGKKNLFLSWIFVIMIFVFAILIKILLINGINLNSINDMAYIILITIVSIFLFIFTFYSWFVYKPFQIYEKGFISEYRGIWFSNLIKKIKIDYTGYYGNKQPIGIMIFHKRKLLPIIIPFKHQSKHKILLKYAIPEIKKSGGKIEFTYDELKKALKYNNVDTSFLETLKYLFEKSPENVKTKTFKKIGEDDE